MTRNRLMQPRAPLQPLSENERHKVDYNVDQLGMDDFAILSDPRNVQTRRAFADRTRALGLDVEAAETEAVFQALRRRWGREFEAKMEAASRYMAHLGLAPHSQRRLMAEMGHEAMFERFAELGQGLAPHERFSDGLADGLVMSEEDAKDELRTLEADRENRTILMDKGHPRHADLVAHRRRLYAIAFPGAHK